MTSQKRVLVFEDLDRDFSLVRGHLRGLGFEVVRASNAQEFRALSPYRGFHAVLIDLFLGDPVNGERVGIGFTREVRDVNPTIPILVVSDLGPTRQLVADVFRVGADDYLDKSELGADLASTIDRIKSRSDSSVDGRREKNLPLPAAFLFRDYRWSSISPKRRLERLVELLEVLLKMTAYGLLADWKERREEQVSIQLRASLAQPSLGHLAQLIQVLEEPRGFLKEIWRVSRLPRFREIVSSLIHLRNEYIGHGVIQADVVYEKLLAVHMPELGELLDLVNCLQVWRLVVPLDSGHLPKAGFSYRLRVFRGSNPEPTIDVETMNLELRPSKHVFLVNEDLDECVDLFPWCQYLVCEERCWREKLFLYQRFRRGEVFLLDHVYGHSLASRSGLEEVQAFLGPAPFLRGE